MSIQDSSVAQGVEYALRMAIQACASHRHELNELEQTAWVAAIETFGVDSTVRFLQDWVSTNSRKSPTVADLRRSLDPSFLEEDSALERLYTLVSAIGPYEAPTIERAGATLCRVIENMGGWARINEVMPDRGDRFAWKAFEERFSTAFGTARTQEFQATLLPVGARPLLQGPVGLHSLSKTKALETQVALGQADLPALLLGQGGADPMTPDLTNGLRRRNGPFQRRRRTPTVASTSRTVRSLRAHEYAHAEPCRL